MPSFNVVLKERHAPHRVIPMGPPVRGVASGEDAIKRVKKVYRGMVKHLEMGDSAWEWVASVAPRSR